MGMDMRARMQQKQGAGRLSGMYALKEGCGMTLEIPSSSKALAHPTLHGVKVCTSMRIFPQYNKDGSPKPMRQFRQMPGSTESVFEPNDFSDWMYAEEGVRFAGCPERGDQFTAFMRTPNSGDSGPTPFKHFWDTMYRALKADEQLRQVFPNSWFLWIGKQGALPRPGWIPLFQGSVFSNYGKEYTNQQTGQPEPRVPCVVLCGKSILDSLCERLNKLKPGVSVGRSDADFELPDIVGDQGLKMQIIFHPQVGKSLSYFDIEPIQHMPIPHAYMQSKVKPWDDIIRLMTEQEQMNILLTHFPTEAVSYAFKSSPFLGLLNAEQIDAWDRLKRQTSFAPGQQAPGQFGFPQQPQQPPYGPPPAQPQGYQTAPSAFPQAPMPVNAPAAAQAPAWSPAPAAQPAWQPQPAPQAVPQGVVTLPAVVSAPPWAPPANSAPPSTPMPAQTTWQGPAHQSPAAQAGLMQPIGDPTVDQQKMAEVAARLRGAHAQFDPSKVPPPPTV